MTYFSHCYHVSISGLISSTQLEAQPCNSPAVYSPSAITRQLIVFLNFSLENPRKCSSLAGLGLSHVN